MYAMTWNQADWVIVPFFYSSLLSPSLAQPLKTVDQSVTSKHSESLSSLPPDPFIFKIDMIAISTILLMVGNLKDLIM